MADVVFRIVLLLLLLAWSGYIVYRLAAGVFEAWRFGRLGVRTWPKRNLRVVRSWAHPIEFWLTMTFWHMMLIVFSIVFALGVYGIWRVFVGH